MPTLEKTIITPAAATGIVNGAYEAVTNYMPFAQVLPDANADSALGVEWTPNKRREQRMADFTAFGATLPYTRQETRTTSMAGLLKVGMREAVTEKDIAAHGDSPDFLRNKLIDYLTQLGTEIAWRVESARLATLIDAQFTVANTVYDFERAANQTTTVVAAKKWSTTAADPISDIDGWQKIVKTQTGVKPTTLITTSDVLDMLAVNAKVIELVPNMLKTPSRVGREEVLNVLKSQLGIDTVVVLDEMYNTIGVKLPEGFTIPQSVAVLAPNLNAYDLGRTAFGTTAAAQSGAYGINNPNGMGLVGYVTSEESPVSYDATGEGTVLPVLENADLTFKATVA